MFLVIGPSLICEEISSLSDKISYWKLYENQTLLLYSARDNVRRPSLEKRRKLAEAIIYTESE